MKTKTNTSARGQMTSPGLPEAPEGLELPASQFGELVNNVTPTVETEWDAKIAEVETPVKITLRLTGSQLTRLKRICSDANQTQDQYVQEQIVEQLENSVGAGVITGPSFANQKAKVRGFTGSVSRG